MDPFDPHAQTRRTRLRHDGPNGTPTPEDELDALAELFLGDVSDASESPSEEIRRRPRGRRDVFPVEGLVLGHLPVFAAAWPAQYARHKAAVLGRPVTVLRVSTGSLIVELVGPNDPPIVPMPDVRDAIRAAVGRSAACLIRVEESGEDDLASVPMLDSLVLLTGADDAAVVACYRKLKSIAAGAEARDAEPPDIRVAIMGAARDRAEITHERIARAAREFLRAELLEPAVLERIASSHARTVFHGPCEHSLEELREMVAGSASEARSVVDPKLPISAAAAPKRAPKPIEACPETAATGDAPAEAFVGTETAAPAGGSCPLAALAGGLRPIESRCPVAAGVRLATDGAGRLHLIAARLKGHAELSTPDPLRGLLRGRSWARLNHAILAKAEPVLASGERAPVLHVVTDDAREARALASTPIRVHLAAPATAAALGLVAVSL